MTKINTDAYLAAIIESSDDAIISKRLDGTITSWNQAAERMFGYTAAEAIGKHISIIIPHDRLTEEEEILSKVSKGEKIAHFHTVRQIKGGGTVEISLNVSPVHDMDGKIIGAAKIARDIRIYRQAESASAYLAAIIESSDDAIISKNMNGTIMSWNAAAERMFKYTPEEALGKHITLIIPAHLIHEEATIIGRLRDGVRIDHFETVRQTKDGRLLDISLTVSPIRDASGKVIGASKVARDITQKKLIEADLYSQRQWFEVTLASIGDAVIATDVDIKVTYLNSIACKLTGWTQEEALGKPLDTVFNIVNENTREPVNHPVQKVIRTGMIQGLANHSMLISKNGTEYSIEDAAAPIRMPDGKLIGVVLVFHDIGDRRILENELKQQADQLIEKDRRKDEFLAMLAHELRNPLAPISNALNILESPSVNPKIQKEVIAMANRQVCHMVRLLDDLLDVSRITHGKITVQLKRIDLGEVIQAAIETAKPLIRTQNHVLKTHMPEYPIWVKGDATRLTQLFGNLLNNAAKYTNSGGTIILEMLEKGNEVTIRVTDNGIGIPQKDLATIFDMFMQVDNSMERTRGGLGIGLTLVQRIAEMHAGNVQVHSDGEGKGTEFVVTLPLLTPDNDSSQQSLFPLEMEASPNSYRILVVDDNEASAKTLGWMLEMLGHQITITHTGAEALSIAESIILHIIFLDIGLPGMNGYEVCKALRKEPSLRNTIIIAQTGWGQEEHRQRSQEAGFDQHLVKPIDIKVLKTLIEKVKHAERVLEH